MIKIAAKVKLLIAGAWVALTVPHAPTAVNVSTVAAAAAPVAYVYLVTKKLFTKALHPSAHDVKPLRRKVPVVKGLPEAEDIAGNTEGNDHNTFHTTSSSSRSIIAGPFSISNLRANSLPEASSCDISSVVKVLGCSLPAVQSI